MLRYFKFLSYSQLQFVKYLFVGGANFLVGLVAFYFFLHILHLNYLISFSISWVASVLLTYIINFVWIFKPEEKLNFKTRLAKYTIIYLFSYLVNLGLLKLLVQDTHYDPFFLQFAIIPVVMAINFTGTKYWALK